MLMKHFVDGYFELVRLYSTVQSFDLEHRKRAMSEGYSDWNANARQENDTELINLVLESYG